jgi:ferredoxin
MRRTASRAVRTLPASGVIYRVQLRFPDQSEHGVDVNEERHILDAALAAGLPLPYSCLQGWCLTCAVRILEGEIDQRDSRRYFPEDRAEGFALICTGRPRSTCVLETHARDAMRRARDKHGLPYPKGDWGQ